MRTHRNAAWRGTLPCTPPTAGEMVAVEEEADPGYGSDVSDSDVEYGGGGDAEVMHRIIAKRDADLDAAESDPDAPPARGSLWSSAARGPGTRRSSRRITPCVPFSFDAGAVAASARGGAAAGGAYHVSARSSSSLSGAVALPPSSAAAVLSAAPFTSTPSAASSSGGLTLPAWTARRAQKRARAEDADAPADEDAHAADVASSAATSVAADSLS